MLRANALTPDSLGPSVGADEASRYSAALWAIIGFATATCLAHVATSGAYGYFSDELYYLACSEHLAWGYVDLPPFVPAVTNASRWLLGDSLGAIRFLPALVAGLKVLITGLMVRELGGRAFAQVLACVAVTIAPGYLVMDSFLSMNCFESFLWTACVYVALVIFRGGDPRLWLMFGALAGLGLLNKYSILLFLAAFVMSLLATFQRRHLSSQWLWLGGLLALLIWSPHLLWEIDHGWPMLEFLAHQKTAGKYAPVTPVDFAMSQILAFHPVALPLWLAGLGWLLFSKAGNPFRSFGVSFVLLWTVITVLQGKDYYLAPAFPVLFASGAVATERWIARRGLGGWTQATIAITLFNSGLISAPIALPMLSPENYVAYTKLLGVAPPGGENEKRPSSPMPMIFAERFAWPELVDAVAGVYDRLSVKEKASCRILASYYGDAGAIDFFGRSRQLPRAVCGHNSYYLWGPGEESPVMIAVGIKLADLQAVFDEVELVATTPHDPFAMPDRVDLPIYVCRGQPDALRVHWSRFKWYW